MKFRCPQNHTFISEDDPAACPDCGWLMAASEGEPEEEWKSAPKRDEEKE